MTLRVKVYGVRALDFASSYIFGYSLGIKILILGLIISIRLEIEEECRRPPLEYFVINQANFYPVHIVSSVSKEDFLNFKLWSTALSISLIDYLVVLVKTF